MRRNPPRPSPSLPFGGLRLLLLPIIIPVWLLGWTINYVAEKKIERTQSKGFHFPPLETKTIGEKHRETRRTI